jgi:hypothetical protein
VQALDELAGIVPEQVLQRDDPVGEQVHRHAEESPGPLRGEPDLDAVLITRVLGQDRRVVQARHERGPALRRRVRGAGLADPDGGAEADDQRDVGRGHLAASQRPLRDLDVAHVVADGPAQARVGVARGHLPAPER